MGVIVEFNIGVIDGICGCRGTGGDAVERVGVGGDEGVKAFVEVVRGELFGAQDVGGGGGVEDPPILLGGARIERRRQFLKTQSLESGSQERSLTERDFCKCLFSHKVFLEPCKEEESSAAVLLYKVGQRISSVFMK